MSNREDEVRVNYYQAMIDRYHRQIAEEESYIKYLNNMMDAAHSKLITLREELELIESNMFGGTE